MISADLFSDSSMDVHEFLIAFNSYVPIHILASYYNEKKSIYLTMNNSNLAREFSTKNSILYTKDIYT